MSDCIAVYKTASVFSRYGLIYILIHIRIHN